jgi:hypothetical protein
MAPQLRQACLAHWPGHHSMNTETRGKKRNSQVSSQRSKAEDHGGDTVSTATVVVEATVQRLRRRGAATCSRPSGQAQHLGATSGLQAAIQPTRRWRTTASIERLGQKLQRGQPEQIKPRRRDPLGGARRRWRRLEARSTNPHGQEEELDETEWLRHRAAAVLAGVGRWGRRRLESPERGIRVRSQPSEGESEGRPAGPGCSGQAHSGWPDQWAQAVSTGFDFN